MKRYICMLGVILFLIFASTCGPEDYYLTIDGIRPPDDDCTYSTCTKFIAWGTADTSLITDITNAGYIVGVQVQNKMINTKDVTKKPGAVEDLPMRTDVNSVVIKKAVVSLRGVASSPNTSSTTKFKSTYNLEITNTLIPSAGDDKTPGQTVVVFSLIPKEKLLQLEELPEWPTDSSTYLDMVAEFYLEGDTFGGVHVRSNTFVYMIKFCYGCLNYLGNKSIGECLSTENCELKGNLCTPGQDGYIMCVCK